MIRLFFYMSILLQLSKQTGIIGLYLGGCMRTLLLLMMITILFGCTEDATVGSSCELLQESKLGITKIEQKNLDCRTLNSDALCVSYVGYDSYCTQKCGPQKVISCDPQCDGDNSCIQQVDGTSSCVPTENLCGIGKDGVCHNGLTCNTTNGRCEASDCPSGYICHNPVQLLGHPFTGVYICIEDPGKCLNHETCGGNGTCSINASGNAECSCNDDDNITYTPDQDKLQCIDDSTITEE